MLNGLQLFLTSEKCHKQYMMIVSMVFRCVAYSIELMEKGFVRDEVFVICYILPLNELI